MLHALFLLAVVGVIVYGIITILPLPAPFRTAIIVLASVFALIIVFQTLGVNTGINLR